MYTARWCPAATPHPRPADPSLAGLRAAGHLLYRLFSCAILRIWYAKWICPMKPINYDMTVYQNASWQLEATFKDPDGVVVDLSNYAGEFVIRSHVFSDTAIFRGDSDTGHVVLSNAATNNVTIKLSATETDVLPTSNTDVEDWVYEFLMWDLADPDYTTVRLLEGSFRVSPSVARDDNT